MFQRGKPCVAFAAQQSPNKSSYVAVVNHRFFHGDEAYSALVRLGNEDVGVILFCHTKQAADIGRKPVSFGIAALVFPPAFLAPRGQSALLSWARRKLFACLCFLAGATLLLGWPRFRLLIFPSVSFSVRSDFFVSALDALSCYTVKVLRGFMKKSERLIGKAFRTDLGFRYGCDVFAHYSHWPIIPKVAL